MSLLFQYDEARRLRHAVHRMVSLALILCVLAGFKSGATDGRILFAFGTDVPRKVQEFAWRVIETRCNFYGSELGQRSSGPTTPERRRLTRLSFIQSRSFQT